MYSIVYHRTQSVLPLIAKSPTQAKHGLGVGRGWLKQLRRDEVGEPLVQAAVELPPRLREPSRELLAQLPETWESSDESG